MADALDSGSSGSNPVRVQVPFSAFIIFIEKLKTLVFSAFFFFQKLKMGQKWGNYFHSVFSVLNRKKILYDTAITAAGTYTLTDSVENYSKVYVVISLYEDEKQPFTNIIPEEMYGIASKIGIPPFSNASYFLDANILLSGNTAKITSFQKGSAVSGARILKIIGSN